MSFPAIFPTGFALVQTTAGTTAFVDTESMTLTITGAQIIGAAGLLGATYMLYNRKWPGDDPTKALDGFEWRGNGVPESSQGNWYNPSTGEILHPDLNHPYPIGNLETF